MTKEILATILKSLEFWRLEDKKIQDALQNFSRSLASSSHPLVSDVSHTKAFIDGVCVTEPCLRDDLEYFAFELSHMEISEGKVGEKKYNLKNLTEYIDFMYELHWHYSVK